MEAEVMMDDYLCTFIGIFWVICDGYWLITHWNLKYNHNSHPHIILFHVKSRPKVLVADRIKTQPPTCPPTNPPKNFPTSPQSNKWSYPGSRNVMWKIDNFERSCLLIDCGIYGIFWVYWCRKQWSFMRNKGMISISCIRRGCIIFWVSLWYSQYWKANPGRW